MTEATPEAQDRVDDGTAAAEAAEAQAAHVADRAPTEAEEAAADKNTLDPPVGEHFQEMAEKGAAIKGEGAIE